MTIRLALICAASVAVAAWTPSDPEKSPDPSTLKPPSQMVSPSAAQPNAVVTGIPPGEPGATTYVAKSPTQGPAELGEYMAKPGRLWIVGKCASGSIKVMIDPLAQFPIDCRKLGDVPFGNQIVITQTTRFTVRVEADPTAVWNLRVEQ